MFGGFENLRSVFRIENNLREPIAIPKVNEDNASVISATMNPARESNRFFDIFSGELVAVVGAVHREGLGSR